MCKLMEDMLEEDRKKRACKNACKMLRDGILSYEKIAEYSGLTIEEVKVLANGE